MTIAAGPRGPGVAATVRSVTGRRPSVLDATQTAIIPLRPLSVGEILDAALLVAQRNARQMIGLPLIIAGGAAVWLMIGVGLWLVLGEATVSGVRIGIAIGMGVLGFFGLVACLVWVTALLSRITLQTALGEGFAPPGDLGWRSAVPILGPTLALAGLQYVALQLVQSVAGVLLYAVLIMVLLIGDSAAVVAYPIASVISFAAFALGYGYLSLTVPALANEAKNAPGWIGKPARPTNAVTAFLRSAQLVGFTGAGRMLAVCAGALLVALVIMTLLSGALYGVVGIFARSLNQRVSEVLSSPWVIGGVTACSVIIALSVVVAFLAAVQTLLYLDLRMRREGLDLALRFDCVPIPQPSAPPPMPPPMLPMAPPLPPLPPARPAGPVPGGVGR